MKKRTHLLFNVLIILFFTHIAYSQTMDSAAVKPFNDGLDKIQKGDYKGAVTDFENALKADNKDYRIYYQIGVAQEKLGNHEKSIQAYNEAIKANPQFDASYNDLGSVYYNLGKYQDAANSFEKVLEIVKDDSAKIAAVKFNLSLSYNALASAAEKSKNYKKAIEYLKKAVSYNNSDIAYLNLARDYFLTNQYDRTIEAAENALKYRKTIGEGGPYYYMGVAYSKKNDMKKAKECMLKAKTDPVYAKVAQTVLDAMK